MVFEYTKNEAGHYVCHHCGVTKEKQNTMHYHLKKHEGTKSHTCSHCDKAFFQKTALDEHIRIQHMNSEPCLACPFGDCNKKFQTKGHLRVHVARNHIRDVIDTWICKNKETGSYTCTCCKKDCKSESAILYHVVDHAKASDDISLQKMLLSV